MKNLVEGILVLMQFMTRFPLSFMKIEYDERKMGKSLKYFPLVGLMIGAVLFLISFFLRNNGYKIIDGLLIVAAEITMVGIIHLDGLADTADGFLSSAPKEKVLEIMKDPSLGTGGAVILILYFIGKISLIGEVLFIDARYILIYPIISRFSTVMNAGLGEYARKEGMSNGIIDENGLREVVFSFILTGILTFAIKELKGLLVLAVSTVFILFFMKRIRKRIGGITGDTMGASLELTSIIVLMAGIIIR